MAVRQPSQDGRPPLYPEQLGQARPPGQKPKPISYDQLTGSLIEEREESGIGFESILIENPK